MTLPAPPAFTLKLAPGFITAVSKLPLSVVEAALLCVSVSSGD